jgi:peptidoglycan/LPS O-acetylase OafA/YrhL
VYHSLQLCRAVAALLVVLFHLGGAIASPKYFALPELARPFSFGHSGVAFFFVLSGFIIAFVHGKDIGHSENLRRYVSKRAARIYPPYLIVFGAVFVMAWLSPSLRAGLPGDWDTIIKSILLLPQDPLVVGGTGAPVLIVAWSLQYEVVFYGLFAIAIFSRMMAALVLAALLASALGCWIGNSCSFPRSFFASYWFLLFLVGTLIARLVSRKIQIKRPRVLALAGVSAFVLVAATEVFTLPADLTRFHLAYGWCSSVIVLGLVRAEDDGALPKPHAIVDALGNSSYALYLIHYPLISVLCKLAVALGLAGLGGAMLTFVAVLVTCLMAAHIFHRVVERRLLTWLNRQWAVRSTAPAGAPR